MACAGDVPTLETLAATALLREELPQLKVRVVNVVDLMRLQDDTEHPHGLSARQSRLARQLQQAARPQLAFVDIALPDGQDRGAPTRIDEPLGRDVAAERERGGQKAPALDPVPPLGPVQPDRTRQPQRAVLVLAREQMLQRRP